MPVLRYDMEVVGLQRVRSAMRSVERIAQQEQRRAARSMGVTPSSMRRSTAAGRDPIAAMQRREEAARHRQAMSNTRREFAEKERQARRFARIQVQEETKAARRAQAEALRTARARERAISGRVGAVGRSVGGSVRAIGATGAGLLALGGGAMVAGAVRRESAIRGTASNIANQAFGNAPGTRQQIFNRSLSTIRSVGASGIGGERAAAGLAKFQAVTGELDIGIGIAQDAANVALASGADFADVMGVAAETMLVMQNRGIGGAEALSQLDEVLATLAAQGKLGSIEFADLATQMAKLGASTSDFEGSVPEIIATMGAMAQIGKRGGAHNVEEATTALMNFRREMTNTTTVNKLKGLGVDPFVYNEQGIRTGIRNPLDVLADVTRSTKGDILESAVMGQRATKVAMPFFTMAQAMGGGDIEKGMRMVKAEFAKFEEARQSKGEREESAAFRRGQSDIQFLQAMEKFNNAVGEQMLPAVTRLIPKFVELTPTIEKAADLFAKLVSSLVDSPLTTLGQLIAAKVTMDIAAAAIGESIKGALVRSFAGGGAGAVAASGKGGGTAPVGFLGGRGVLGNAAAGLAIASAAITIKNVGELIIEDISKDVSKGQGTATASEASLFAAGLGAEQATRKGTVTAGRAEEALQQRTELGSRIFAAEQRKKTGGFLEGLTDVGGLLAGLVGAEGGKTVEQIAAERQDVQNLATMKESFGRVDKLVQQLGSGNLRVIIANPQDIRGGGSASGAGVNRADSPSAPGS